MMTRKLTITLAAALGALCWIVTPAQAADDILAPATRGTVKVAPRFFNPFEVGISRFAIDPFGGFTVTTPTAVTSLTQLSSGGGAAATSSSTAQTAVVTAAPPIMVSPLAARPPFVPPDRSPFRPPPRPPFPP
jgi:hypothetical protein